MSFLLKNIEFLSELEKTLVIFMIEKIKKDMTHYLFCSLMIAFISIHSIFLSPVQVDVSIFG